MLARLNMWPGRWPWHVLIRPPVNVHIGSSKHWIDIIDLPPEPPRELAAGTGGLPVARALRRGARKHTLALKSA